MRKLKLLLASVALLFGGGISVNAQWTDVTSTYIKNPSFELGKDGNSAASPASGAFDAPYSWNPTNMPTDGTRNFGVFKNDGNTPSNFGKNVEPADGTYYYLARNSWSASLTTSLSQTSTAIMPEGAYMLKISYKIAKTNGDLNPKGYLTLGINQGETTLGSKNSNISASQNNTYFNTADWTDLKVPFTVANEGTVDFVITFNFNPGKANIPQEAIIIDDVRLFSLTNGDDVTSLITNAAVTSTSGWTNGRTNSNQQYTGAPDNTYMDTWNATLDQKQTVTLPSGYYLLKAATRASEGITGGTIYGYVKEDDITFQTDIHKEGAGGNLLGNGWAWTRVPVTVTQTSDVTIGFWSNCSGSQWAGADNFTLTYYDSELNLKAAQFEQVRSDATAWKTSLGESISTGAKSLLAAEDGKSYASVEDYNAAIARLEAAITFARITYLTLKTRYDAIKVQAKSLPDQTDVYTGSATISVDEAALDAQVDAATTEEEFNAAILAWRNAAATFLGAVTVKEGQYFNITNIFLDNADFSAGNILGWETNYVSGQQAQNIGYQGANYTNEDVTISQFIEAWKPQPGTLGDGYLRQTVQNLPEGKYTLEADAISVQQKDENLEVAGSYLYIYADGVDYKTALNTLNNKPQHFSREFLFTGEGDVVFGLKTESSTGNWLCADNFVVKFYGIDLTAYVTQLADAVAEAEAVTGIPKGAATVLEGVVTEYNKSYNTSKAYAAAISAIQTATATALSFKTPFANYNTAKETAETFEEDAMFADAWTALQDAIPSCTISNEDLANTSITVETLNTATANFVNANNAATAAVAAKTTYTNATELINGGTDIDLTSLIGNPSFESTAAYALVAGGWVNEGVGIQGQTNSGFDGYRVGTVFAERWTGSGTIGAFKTYQTIEALPAGLYEVSVVATFNGSGASLIVNGETTPITDAGTYSLLVQVADKGSLELGVQAVSPTGSWFKADNFTLNYFSDFPEYTLATGKMGTDKSAAQTVAEETFNASKTVANYNALLAAIAEAEASVANYTALKAAIDKANEEKNANNFVTAAATTTFEGVIATETTAWENVTYTDKQAKDAVGALKTAACNYMGSAWIIPDPKPEGWWYFNTWSTEGDTDGTDFFNPFFENFVSDTKNLPDNTFTAQLTGLENGCYEIEVWARVQRRTDADFNADNSMITMNVNGGDAVSLMSGQTTVGSGGSTMRLGRYTARGMVTDGTLTLTINVKLGANVHWLSWRDVKYTKVADDAITVSNAGYATYASDNDLDFTNVTGLNAYKATIDGTHITFTKVTTVPAGEGVMLKGDEGNYSVPVTTGVDAWADDDNAFVRGTDATVVSKDGSTYNYVLSSKNGNVGFYPASGKVVAKDKAYISTTVDAARLSFSFGDETTGIMNFTPALSEGEGVYDLQGRKVVQPTKGLYIQNGKKVIMK